MFALELDPPAVPGILIIMNICSLHYFDDDHMYHQKSLVLYHEIDHHVENLPCLPCSLHYFNDDHK